MVDDAARLRIRTDLASTLFVEAGAGAGKTSVLVDRVVELVASGVTIESIAVITFTEAAAAELRERVRARLADAVSVAQADGDTQRALRAREALAGLDGAAISTLHAFAYRIVAEEALAAGLPPQIQVIDDIASRIRFDHRWSEFVDDLHGRPELQDVLEFASALDLRFHPAYPGHRTLKDVAADLSDNWDRLDAEHVVAGGLRPSLGGVVTELRTAASSAGAGLRDLVQRCVDDSDQLLRAVVEKVLPELDRIAEEDDDLALVRSLTGFSPWRVGNIGRAASWPGCRDEVRSAVAGAGAAIADGCSRVAAQTLGMLAPFVVEHVVDSARARRESGRLEFHDLLVIARDLLRTDRAARTRLHQAYARVLLDEFQDTDPIQIELAVLIAGGPDDGSVDWRCIEVPSGRLVVVGDPKQSIYRFRRADIAIYNAASERFSEGSDGPTQLTANFRSVRPVVAWINDLFSSIMSGGGPSATQARFTAMVAVRDPAPGNAADHRPLLLGGPRDRPASLLREEEAAAVASTIVDIASRPDRWPVADPSGRWRQPRLSDVTVLVPARTSVPQLVAALSRAEVPHQLATGALAFDAPDVRDVISVVRAIDDPSDPIKVVAALRSNLYACSDRHLAEAASAGAQWTLADDIADGVGLGADHPVREAFEHLRQMVAGQRWRGASDVVERLLADRHAAILPLADGDPAATWLRLRVLIDRAQEFDVHVGGGLREFVRWVELQSSERSTVHEPMLDEPDVDAVKIMTIHGAKGLEFPIAIVSGLTTRLAPTGRQRTSVVFGEAGPEFRVGSAAETSRFMTQLDIDVAMDEAERVRLLYVATTRARDHLVVSAFHNPVRSGASTSFGEIVWAHEELRASELGDESAHLSRRLDVVASDSRVRLEPLAPTVDAGTLEPVAVGVPASARRRSVVSPTALSAAMSAVKGSTRSDSTRSDSTRSDSMQPPGGESDRAGNPGGAEGGADGFGRGGQPEDDGGVGGAALGRAVHWVLERVDFGVDRRGADVAALVDAAVAHEPGVSAALCGALVRSAIATPTVRLAALHRHWREVPVCSELGGVALDGVVDLIIALPNGLLVVDFKTDRVHSELVGERVAHHRPQLAAYAAAVGRATGEPIAGARIVFLRPDGWDERDIEDLAAAQVELEHYLLARST